MRDTAEGDEVGNGRYRLEELVGRGGMGEVWRAYDQRLKRTVALKSARMSNAQAAERLRREAQHAARPKHQNIVDVFDSFDEGPTCWIVMEYVPAPSLARLLQDRGPRTLKYTADIGRQLAAALTASHANGVVHGDVTPENVLVTDDDVAKLTDFGISRARWSTYDGTSKGGVQGKLRYLPPEVAQGRPADEKSDVFSLGATLYAVLEGHSPYGEADDDIEYFRRASAGEIEPPTRADRLTPMLTAMLRAEPERRPSAAEAHAMLSRFHVLNAPGEGGLHNVLTESVEFVPRLEPEPDGPARTSRWPGRWSRLRRHPGAIAGAALLTTTAVVTAIVTGLEHDRNESGPAASGPATAAPGPRPVKNAGQLGDAHTADPCGLLDAATFRRFGEAHEVTDYGELDRCDILLIDGDDDEISDIELNFASEPGEPDSQTAMKKVGAVTVVELPEDDGSCARNIRLPDGNQIWITGDEDAPESPDACTLAQAATDHAADLLNRGPVPRRPGAFPNASLARLNACELLDDSALSVLPGIHTTDEKPGFAEWDCEWSNDTTTGGIEIRFNRDNDLTDNGKLTHLGGAESYVAPAFDDQDDTCAVMTVNRTYTNTAGDHTVEYVELTTYGPRPMDDLCDTAKALATAVVKKLPTLR